MLLIVLTGELDVEEYEFRLLLAADEDDDRRREVRSFWGENRAARAWNRDDCILDGVLVPCC